MVLSTKKMEMKLIHDIKVIYHFSSRTSWSETVLSSFSLKVKKLLNIAVLSESVINWREENVAHGRVDTALMGLIEPLKWKQRHSFCCNGKKNGSVESLPTVDWISNAAAIKVPKWCHDPCGTLMSNAELPPTGSRIPLKRRRCGLFLVFLFSQPNEQSSVSVKTQIRTFCGIQEIMEI